MPVAFNALNPSLPGQKVAMLGSSRNLTEAELCCYCFGKTHQSEDRYLIVMGKHR